MNKYYDFLSKEMQDYLDQSSCEIPEIKGLKEVGQRGGLENIASLQFLVELYNLVKDELNDLLIQRNLDRKFIDLRTEAICQKNIKEGRSIDQEEYESVLGLEDSSGRIVVGPLNKDYVKSNGEMVAEIPNFLKGVHVTLFGPPGSPKMSINAMNSLHRKLKNEPEIIETLLSTQDIVPMWGADDEDSKTPLRSDLIIAGENLSKCFDGTLSFIDPVTKKNYELCNEKRALPIKRFPGLALPSTFLFFENKPIPLHLYDFALHLFKNWNNPKALVFYVPKLENEQEARYIKHMIENAERMIKKLHKEYVLGSVRVLVVLENPRAVFRVNEMMDELFPYFAGASLGWHDYLASTARIFKEDRNYRIPVKADPNIVIKHILASHRLLAEVVGKRGGIKIGGMYGVLPNSYEIDSESFQSSIKGFVKDVITQLKRDLNGFWVAHPDFVRLGMALVEAWKQYSLGKEENLFKFINELIDKKYQQELIDFIKGPDISGLDYDDGMYQRSLIVADIKESTYISNSDPKEIAYNIFQTLQYLADWLCGNGCVALPAQIDNISVRMMDDLATTERSRFEVWHELKHGRISLEQFLQIAFEEYNFIRKDLSNADKIVQIKWNNQTEKWYPIAFKIMIKLMTDQTPVEFVTQYLMPFTIESIRKSTNPWEKVLEIDSKKFQLREEIARFNYYFEICGDLQFAKEMARDLTTDIDKAKKLILNFDKQSILSAASFHGDIGEAKAHLDTMAKNEQSCVGDDRNELVLKAKQYLAKFNMKFLISAKGLSTQDLLSQLNIRLGNSQKQEEDNAKNALLEITLKRFINYPLNHITEEIENLKKKDEIIGATIAISTGLENIQSLSFGKISKNAQNVCSNTWFEFASLSKSVATAYCIDFFKNKNISLTSNVNSLLKHYNSNFIFDDSLEYIDQLQLNHLFSHCALNMHYVNGIPANKIMPDINKFLNGNVEYDYDPITIINKPGSTFRYSGAGFILLEYLIELIGKDSIENLTKDFLTKLGLINFSFIQKDIDDPTISYACGHSNKGALIEGNRKMFPSFAAGAMGNATEMNKFLSHLTKAYHQLKGRGGISHDCAVEMLYGQDLGSFEFMGCLMGKGIFTAEAGKNKLMIHQGANDGFRSIFIYVFDGPDLGKGFTIQSSGEENAVHFIAKTSQFLLKKLNISGIDFNKLNDGFDLLNPDISQEQVVNLGYKEFIFNAFIPSLPEPILKKRGELNPLLEKSFLIDSRVCFVTNQKFALVENLISAREPVFDPDLFGAQGKVMDSWESVRHNTAPYDFVILETTKILSPQYLFISTKYHDGNQVESFAIEGSIDCKSWENILKPIKVEGHSYKFLKLEETKSKGFKFFKIKIFPDGGLSRLALFENCPKERNQIENNQWIKYSESIPSSSKPLSIPFKENSNLEFISASNQHYGSARQILSPYKPISMFDGFESARSRESNHYEEILLRLKSKKIIDSIKIDFKYFVNNTPKTIEVLGMINNEEFPFVEKTFVKPYAGNCILIYFKSLSEKNRTKIFDHLKIKIYPDGGFNRFVINFQ